MSISADLSSELRGRRPEPALYDFRRPNRFSREHVRALQIVNETFARQFSTVLSTTLRVVSQVNVVSVAQITYDEYVRRVPTPSLLAVLAFDPLPGAGVFQLPMDIVMTVIDRLLGGTGGSSQPNRALSEIETGLIRQLLQRIVHELTYSFESLSPVDARVISLESDAQFMQLASASEPVIVSSLDIRIGELQATSTLCISFATLQPLLDAIGSRKQVPAAVAIAAAASTAIEERLQGVPVEVTVCFRPVTLTSREVLSLAIGDLLPLRQAVAEPLSIQADGVTVAAAVPGRHGERLACQIVHPRTEDSR